MPLTNAQYDSIMRIYDNRRQKDHSEQQKRIREAYTKIPRLPEIDSEIASLSVRKAEILLSENASTDGDIDFDLAGAIRDLSEERKALLLMNGYPADYLEEHYTCPDCRDTGFIDGRKCHCFLREELRILYRQSNVEQQLGEDSFDHFRLDLYSDAVDPEYGVSPRDEAAHALRTAREFVGNFQRSLKPENLFISGPVGVGKTYLTHCIARELLSENHSVLYLASQDLFRLLGRYTFSRGGSRSPEDAGETDEAYEALFSCDLLIIDDLGTEISNTFVTTQLFLLMNERAARRKSLILSTNMSLAEIRDTYSERISSRILGSCTLVHMSGTDIRTLM